MALAHDSAVVIEGVGGDPVDEGSPIRGRTKAETDYSGAPSFTLSLDRTDCGLCKGSLGSSQGAAKSLYDASLGLSNHWQGAFIQPKLDGKFGQLTRFSHPVLLRSQKTSLI